jgi:hypothetical protein
MTIIGKFKILIFLFIGIIKDDEKNNPIIGVITIPECTRACETNHLSLFSDQIDNFEKLN